MYDTGSRIANDSLCPCVYNRLPGTSPYLYEHSMEVPNVSEAARSLSRMSGPQHVLQSPDVHQRPRGYLVAFRHYEQQTQALRNYLQLQCFAHSLGLRVVEPFVLKSFLAFPMDRLLLGEKLMRCGDLIDLGLWNRETGEKFGYSPVTEWGEFLRTASPNVIIVCMKFRAPPRIKLPTAGFNYATGCNDDCFNKFNSSLALLRKHNPDSRLVHRACANFVDFAGIVSVDSFVDNILGSYADKDVTVLMTEFRGFFGMFRVPVLSQCGFTHFKTHDISILPSARIMKDAERYVASVLSSQPYMAILARVERTVLHLHHNMSTCARDLVQLLQKLQITHGVDHYFLGMDIGAYGSRGAELKHLLPYGKIIFDAVYQKKKWTFKEWEDSFERFASVKESGYVANLQRTVAARADCLIMVGGGGFQAQSRDLYQRLHPDLASQCIHKVCCSESML